MIGKTWRRASVAAAFLTGAVLLVGHANPGKTNEIAVDLCDAAVWPVIPPNCFAGGQVRPEQPSRPVPDVPSEKADLLERPDSAELYRTVEIRRDGVSELRRMQRTNFE